MYIVLAAKDLIRGLLCTDPDQRLNIKQVIANKWVAVSTDLFTLTLKQVRIFKLTGEGRLR